ncbi:threonine-phosphate decarboxylase [Vibrio sp. 10N.261.46.E11]|uniref:threonine-phosphate decarboxylase n=1 Tax=Vibrio sp. 10N.261.46.E11 TaxID=3229662 RepID=UPI00354F39F9
MTIKQHSTSNELPHHGGKLIEFSLRYQRPIEQWVDLSTGVSPHHYPIPEIPASVWNRLPEDDDGLITAAQTYYQSDALLPVAGSQAAIQSLPHMIAKTQPTLTHILLPHTGYKEHQHAWQQYAEQSIQAVIFDFYRHKPTIEQLKTADVVVVINPNNPTALSVPPSEVLTWLDYIRDHSTLVIDEAFVDCTPELSVLPSFPTGVPDNLIVLRSVGKFFGLAGIRAGFCFASPLRLNILKQHLGPWTLSGPTRYVTTHALLNSHWQKENRQRLHEEAERMDQLLQQYFGQMAGSTKITSQILFHRVEISDSASWHHQLAKLGVFTRHCDENDALRFGLPANESQWQALTRALEQLKE